MKSLPMYYTFPAIRGVQAGREYYVTMCPLRLIPRIFLFDDEELEPDFRAQRVINKSRIPSITEYMVENPTEYCFSSITASVDADVEFTPISGEASHYNIGSIKIPMVAKIIVNDGQHRRAAIEMALKAKPGLGDETISIVLFIDAGLQRSQQMFADLNRYAVRPTQSLNILYDHRDPEAELARMLIRKVDIFNGLTETDKSTISNRSSKVFTLSGIYRATKELLEKNQKLDNNEQTQLSVDFWNEVSSNIEEWQYVKNGEMSPAELRRNYIHAHAITLSAIGRMGKTLLEVYPDEWKDHLVKLREVDWHRNNVQQWEGRTTVGGKISFSRNNLMLLTSALKQILELPLSEEELMAEETYAASRA